MPRVYTSEQGFSVVLPCHRVTMVPDFGSQSQAFVRTNLNIFAGQTRKPIRSIRQDFL